MLFCMKPFLYLQSSALQGSRLRNTGFCMVSHSGRKFTVAWVQKCGMFIADKNWHNPKRSVKVKSHEVA
jgi:hypothetical protein